MKKILLSVFIIASVFVLTGCFNINFGDLDSVGKLEVVNNGSDPIKAIVAYKDGEEYYRIDNTYKDSSGIVGECNIPVGSSFIYEWDTGSYDIWLFTYYKKDNYWYYCIKEDVYVSSGTTTITLEQEESNVLVPANVSSSMYNKLPEVVKAQIFQ